MPKLPADLPENWTQGQTISPNGTETGLTEQHGYNYLMKQVNNTQTEVNNINGALPDVAQQATVEEIKNKIGTEADADTQPTLFGRLAQLKNVLLEKLTELLTKVTGIDGKIGTSGDSEDSGTIFGTLKKILIRVYDTAILVPSDNVKTTLYSTQIDTSGKVLLLRRIAPHSGKIKVKLNLISTGSNTGCYLAYGSIDDLSMQETAIPVADVTIPIMNTASAILNGEEGDTLTSAANIGKGSVYPFYTAFYMTSTGNDVDRTIIIPVKKMLNTL